MKNHVFLSYSFKDIHRARRLRDVLRLFGLEVWPSDILTPGIPSWKAVMQERLENACCVVVILSKDSHMSNWVSSVLEYAAQHQLPVLPAVMDGTAGNLLLVEVDGEHWFDLRWSRNFASECVEMVSVIRGYMTQETMQQEL
ncbi:MAG: toll/interleukin-1 receptor domain-containing protein [Anaerolineae bacterium]|nr:toll/interleukin-1 receptor domain-containing protein [Anaerolineae bacterium]